MNKKYIIFFLLSCVITYLIVIYKNYSYYSVISNDECKKLKEYCIKNNYNSDICIIVDFNKYSGNKRLYIYNLNSNVKEISGKVAHGIGKTFNIFNPEFSNNIDSWNSSLGKYKLGRTRTMSNIGDGKIPCIELYGLDSTNSNAYTRGILIHPGLITDLPTTPIPCEPFSQGCFTVSDKIFKQILSLKDNSNKPILLYAFK